MAKRILLVDDDLYIRDIYLELLQSEGYEVEVAVDGKEGLEKLQVGGYDLVLLDIMLPQIDGIGILTTLTETPPKKPNGPIIILTGLSHDRVVKEAMQKGANSVILKTDIAPDQFIAKVKEVLQ